MVQNIFRQMYHKLIYIRNVRRISEESIENIDSDNTFDASLTDHHLLPRVLFAGNCLRISSISVQEKEVDLCISCTLNPWSRDLFKCRFHIGKLFIWNCRIN